MPQIGGLIPDQPLLAELTGIFKIIVTAQMHMPTTNLNADVPPLLPEELELHFDMENRMQELAAIAKMGDAGFLVIHFSNNDQGGESSL